MLERAAIRGRALAAKESGAKGDRTPNLRLATAALSQLNYGQERAIAKCGVVLRFYVATGIWQSRRGSGEEASKIAALDAGADDYLTKPFGVGELLARIRVALRHAANAGADGPPQTVVQAGAVSIDLAGRTVTKGDAEVKLTKIEFDLLAVLARNVGKVVTHRQLLKEVWGPHAVQEPHYVRVFMATLRKKLERNPGAPNC
jgi:hypothetical protein